MSTATDLSVRRELREEDPERIVELHRRVYVPEFGRNEAFLEAVREALGTAVATGWPRQNGAVWLLDRGDELTGSIGLTQEGEAAGWVRWVVFDPWLRGRGLGRRLLSDLLEEARAAGLRRLKLNTFSALSAAAHLYREAGFRVIWEQERGDWGPPIVYQHYELEL